MDKLNMDKLNNLQHPLLGNFLGGDSWPIESICVETGLVQIDACGMTSVKEFWELNTITDGDGGVHDADDFWIERGGVK